MGPGPWVPGPLGVLIAMEIFHNVNLGFGPGPWVPGPLGLPIAVEIFHDEILGIGSRSLGPSPLRLVIAMEIFHDEILGFGPRSLGPRPFRAPHRHGIFRDEAQVPGSQALQGYSSPWKYSMMGFWGLGPGPWVPGPLGLLIAREILHDVDLGFGPRFLGPRPFRVTHRHGNIP